MIKYKYILFDFDGTLANSTHVFLTVYNQLAARYKGKHILQSEVEQLRKLSIMERCRTLGLPLYKLPYMIREFYPLYKKTLKDVTIFEGIKEMLIELKIRGYILIIVSSNSKENILEFLNFHQINEFMNIYCSRNIFGKDKVINKIIKNRKLSKDEVLYIGDEQRDIQACKRCGIKMVWVEWGFDSLETIKDEKPDFIVSKPNEILKILN